MELITGENDKGRRLDRILRKALPDHPLPLIHRLLRQGQVFVNGKPAKAQDRPDYGVKISIPSLKDAPKPAPETPFLPPPAIIWEGPGLIAVNKPAGLAVHGPESLDSMVRSFLADKITPSLSFKPGPLHRLDKPSSGIVVFSTDIDGARLFSALMRERRVKKTYLAVVEGNVKKEEIWEDELFRDREKKKTFVSQDGKDAVTAIKPLASNGEYSLIAAQIATGRTHQIRAQAAARGHPLAGDKKYGGHGKAGLLLHAWKLEFLEYSIEAPIPEAFKSGPPPFLTSITTLFSFFTYP
ncbi:MAG: RluA family pseudouridine synthase [Treponema sp.]|jgi:23S rRNA pseudouridine955/2504/2580 synthase|nr:RluA family pseudouridine synthase [Treponema sp.]